MRLKEIILLGVLITFVATADPGIILASSYHYEKPKPNERIIKASTNQISKEQIQARIRQLFGPDAGDAELIVACESSWNPNAYNPGGYFGLFQIGAIHVARFGSAFMSDPVANIEVAYKMFKEQGNWSAWECKKVLK